MNVPIVHVIVVDFPICSLAKVDTMATDSLDFEALRANFTYLYLKRIEPERNIRRFYYIGWHPMLYGMAVIRIFGRIGGQHQMMTPAIFSSLDEAWPLIRQTIRTRLRHGYVVASLPKFELPQPGL
ncbi:WGR domain-containing protein [Candidatus Saccharibacteria bacterium]|nr:WGR domain-containing protein [Candidatus Saccharibacteria bacterium]